MEGKESKDAVTMAPAAAAAAPAPTTPSPAGNPGKENPMELTPIDIAILPELEGSPKQIAWANDIRTKFVADFNMHLAERGAGPADDPRMAPILAGFAEIPNLVDSRFWIENRGAPLATLRAAADHAAQPICQHCGLRFADRDAQFAAEAFASHERRCARKAAS